MSTNLPVNLQDLATGLIQSAAAQGADADGYLKFAKGFWIYGKEDTETQEGAEFAINPLTLRHGWVAWGDEGTSAEGVKCGEVMTSIREPLYPAQNLDLIEQAQWTQQVEIQLRCLNGEDEGLQFIVNFNSSGGRKAYGKLSTQIVERINSGVDTIVPIVELDKESYKHPKYGQVYTPLFRVVDWLTLDGLPDEDGENSEHIEEEPEEVVEDVVEPRRPAARAQTRTESATRPATEKPAARTSARPAAKASAQTAAKPAGERATRRKPSRPAA